MRRLIAGGPSLSFHSREVERPPFSLTGLPACPPTERCRVRPWHGARETRSKSGPHARGVSPMLRKVVSSLVVLVLFSGVALSADKAKTVGGKFASFKDGTLTIKVAGKKGEEPK